MVELVIIAHQSIVSFYPRIVGLKQMEAPRDIPAFERWCSEQAIEIDERLEIRTESLDNTISVYTKPNVNVAIGESRMD